MHQARLIALVAVLAGCSERAPQDPPGAGGGGGGTPSEPESVIGVDVTSRGFQIPGLDVLVHDANGALLRRVVSTVPLLVIEARPSDSVSLVWRDPAHSSLEDGWTVDTVRVTESMHVWFVIDAEVPPLDPPNTPVDVQIEAERADNVSELFVGLSCAPSLPTSGSATFMSYVGCPDGTPSMAWAAGEDADGRLVTFATEMVSHIDATQTIELPSTPVPVEYGRIELLWEDAAIDLVQGSTLLGGPLYAHFDPETAQLTSAAQPDSPVVYEPRLAPPLGATVNIEAVVNGSATSCDRSMTVNTALGAELQRWQLDWLAAPDVGVDPYRWSIASEGAHGDAALIEISFRHGRYRWVEPVVEGEHTITFPELPDDLAAHFEQTRENLTGTHVTHDARTGTHGYLEYVSAGEGNRGLFKGDGQTSQVGPCVGRY